MITIKPWWSAHSAQAAAFSTFVLIAYLMVYIPLLYRVIICDDGISKKIIVEEKKICRLL